MLLIESRKPSSFAVRREVILAGFVEFVRDFAEFVFVVALLVLIAWRRVKTYQDTFGESRTKIQTLFGKDRWWQP